MRAIICLDGLMKRGGRSRHNDVTLEMESCRFLEIRKFTLTEFSDSLTITIPRSILIVAKLHFATHTRIPPSTQRRNQYSETVFARQVSSTFSQSTHPSCRWPPASKIAARVVQRQGFGHARCQVPSVGREEILPLPALRQPSIGSHHFILS